MCVCAIVKNLEESEKDLSIALGLRVMNFGITKDTMKEKTRMPEVLYSKEYFYLKK